MKHFRDVVEKIDQAIIKSRLNSLTLMMMTDRSERIRRIATVLQELPKGAYLIGTGPSTVGIIPLTVEEVVLGRAATPLEEPAEAVVDYEIGDAMYLGPHEVSRVHAMASSQAASIPEVQSPSMHVSSSVQAEPSSQLVPSG